MTRPRSAFARISAINPSRRQRPGYTPAPPWSWTAQLSAYPVSTGRLHAGFYGQAGAASRSDDGVQIDDGSFLLGSGALLQLDLTTTLAITGRAGLTRAYGETLRDFGIGIQIY